MLGHNNKNMTKEIILEQVEYLTSLGKDTYKTKGGGYPSYVDNLKFSRLKSGGLSFIKNVFTESHPYFKDFEENVSTNSPHDTQTAIGILESIKLEFERGWISSLKGLVAEEIFSDLIDMSEYFMSEGYKDPAAVMIGCVLEEHIKQLCEANGIEVTIEKGDKHIPKKANLLNADLAKAGTYGQLDSKNIIAWFDLRNSAAHGKFDKYNKEQVQTMLNGVTEFIARVKI
jgi:hypothetical protein